MAKLYFVCAILLAGTSPLTADDVNRIQLNGTFDEQVAEIMRQRQPHREDIKATYKVIADVKMAMRTVWPDAELTPIGSRFTGVGTAKSDVDCFIHLPSNQETNSSIIVDKAVTALRQYPHLFTHLDVREYSRVPIAMAVHVPTQLDVDVSFTGSSSIGNTKLLRYLLHLDDRILKLAVITKYWEKIQMEQTLSSYGSLLMVIFYLQQNELLPPIARLQKDVEPVIEDSWNLAFERIPFEPHSNLTLFDLLFGYFEYFANFDYEKYVISPFIGYPLERERFVHYQSLPEEFALYKFKMENNLTCPLYLNSIVIQEPFEHNRNLATDIHYSSAQIRIAAFKKANHMYLYQTISKSDEYLRLILKP